MVQIYFKHAFMILRSTNLSLVVGRDATHVVMNGGQHGDGLPGDVDAGEDHGGLRDAREPLGQLLLRQVV